MKTSDDRQEQTGAGWREQALDDGRTIVSVRPSINDPAHELLFRVELYRVGASSCVSGWIRSDGVVSLRNLDRFPVVLVTDEDEDVDDVTRLARALRRVRLLAASMISAWAGS